MSVTFEIQRADWVPLSGRTFTGPANVMSALDRWVIHYRGVVTYELDFAA